MHQLVLHFDGVDTTAAQWEQLPDEARGRVLVLLAGMIARGVVDDSAVGGGQVDDD